MMMIYLDNAAGSWPKPPEVGQAMVEALEHYGANPGRGGYELSRRTAEMVDGVRRQIAELVNAPDYRRVVFTAGATMSLNMALIGYLRHGDHVVYSGVEHNAVFRPLYALANSGRISISRIPADSDGYISAEAVGKLLKPATALIAICHASNVSGSVQPLAEVAALARCKRIPLLVDAAQSVGLLPIDVRKLDIGMLALPAHKALYGPSGVGALYVREGLRLTPLLSGGTGSQSERKTQPNQYPDHLEAGSLNTVGIAGWGASLNFVAQTGVDTLYSHSMDLLEMLVERLRRQPRVKLYLPETERPRVPVLAFDVRGLTAAEAASFLNERGFCLRSGYHCAPLAHRSLHSFGEGSIRVSPGWYNTPEHLEALAAAVEELTKTKR